MQGISKYSKHFENLEACNTKKLGHLARDILVGDGDVEKDHRLLDLLKFPTSDDHNARLH